MSNGLLETLTALKRDVVEAGDARTEACKDLRARIEAGETTGDEIMDFLVWMWPLGHDDALPHYHALAARLRGKRGELMLMIERSEESTGAVTLGPGMEESFTLGVLTDDRLLLERAERGRLAFPTERYAKSDERTRRSVRVADGPMRPWLYDTIFWHKTEHPMAFHLERSEGCFGSPGLSLEFCLGVDADKPVTELEFLIGDAEIADWCCRGAMHVAHGEANPRRCDLVIALARKLGFDVDAIRTFRKYRESRRTEAINRLHELKIRREELLMGIEDPEGGDARELVSELRKTRREISSALETALDVGLDREPFVKRMLSKFPDPAK